jgi:hypothetical protein
MAPLSFPAIPPRFLRFSDNALCQVDDVETLHTALAVEGVEQDSLSLWEHNQRLVMP